MPKVFEVPDGYQISKHAEDEELFMFLKDLYAAQGPDSMMGGRWSRSLVSSELKSSALLALRDQVGYLRSMILYKTLPDGFEITILGTAKPHRNKGLMRCLIGCLQDLARSSKRRIFLEVHQQNPVAHDFYEELRFQRRGLRTGYYSDGADAILMDWRPELSEGPSQA
ncbi:MAG: GNAT family N-acetyltransferase [Bdellovibrionales bacterium]|nr:GNAT family N-acetyltransferase [Bdellovibrionales bacterium]